MGLPQMGLARELLRYMEGNKEMTEQVDIAVALNRVGQELQAIKVMMQTVVSYIKEAEADMPERYRRFVNAFHDVHDIKFFYEEHGQEVPQYILSEVRRMDDRYRQILTELNANGGAFEKVRRKMAEDPLNRWDHTKQLAKPQENGQ